VPRKLLYVQKVKGYSGSEKVILESLVALRERGYEGEMLVVYPEEAEAGAQAFIDKLEARDIPVHRIAIRRDLSLHLIRQIAALLRQGNYDLVHTHLIHADVWLALVKQFFLPRLPLISTKHNYDDRYTDTHGFDPAYLSWRDRYFVLSKLAEKKVDFSITVSRGLFRLYAEGKISPPEALRCIPLGFDLPDFVPPERSACRLAPRQLVIVGRLIAFKGHRFVIRILPDLLQTFPDLKLVMVGDGDEKENLMQLAREEGVEEAVHFTGYQTNVFEWMNQSDGVLIPSVSEGFGIVILEAFNSRSPVVAFDVPAPNEIIEHEKTGLLVPPFDLNELKAAITRFLSRPEEGKKMAEVAYQRLKSYYCLDRMVGEIVEVYERLEK
jgi:glycosyltransferase involved in cell wall biosynthesis